MPTDLTTLVPPPQAPLDASDLDWAKVEKKLKTTLPADYKRYIETYGTGAFAGFYYVYSPFTAGSVNLIDNAKSLGKDYKQRHKDEPDEAPYPAYPAKGGLLPWGNDENGNYYFWLTRGDPDTWQVVADDTRGLGFIDYDCSFSAFLASVMQGDLKALASNFPRPENRVFVPYEPPPPHPGEEMYNAIKKNDCARVKQLLESGVDPNGTDAYGERLFTSAVCKSAAMIKVFLEHGADANLDSGPPVLEIAANSLDWPRVQALLDGGATINQISYSCLACVVSAHAPAFVRKLLAQGVNPNLRGEEQAALHSAVWASDLETLQILLEYGADPNIKDSNGRTPLDLAKERDRAAIADFLGNLRPQNKTK